MTHEHETDEVDALLAQARHERPGPELMARVRADAATVQAEVRTRAQAEVPRRRAWMAGLIGAIGGWSAVSGITAAGVMGLAVGLYAPDTVADLLANDRLSLGLDSYYLTPDLSGLWTEDGDV